MAQSRSLSHASVRVRAPTRAASMPSQPHACATPRAGILAREAPHASQVWQRGPALEARGDPGDRGASSQEGLAYHAYGVAGGADAAIGAGLPQPPSLLVMVA
jgi:hypothetical protein